MDSRILAAALLLGASACKEAERAPLALEDANVFLFTNFEEADEVLAPVIADLEAAMATIDLAGDLDLRSFTVPILAFDQLGGANAPAEVEAINQIPSLILGESTHDYATNKTVATELNHVCIESNSTKFYGRTIVSDQACWDDGSCAVLRTTNEVRKENALAKAWYDLFKDYRVVVLEDGREAMISRAWIEDVFVGDRGSNEFAQTFTIEAWIPGESTTLRSYGMWAEINIGLGDDLMQGQIIDGVDEGFGNADGFLGGDTSDCGADRDRAYDREVEE